jgi:hypothetical protein
MAPVSHTIQPLLIVTVLQNFIGGSKFVLFFRVVPTVPHTQLSFSILWRVHNFPLKLILFPYLITWLSEMNLYLIGYFPTNAIILPFSINFCTAR